MKTTFTEREQSVLDWAAHHRVVEPAGDTREVCEALATQGYLEEVAGHDPRFSVFKPTDLGERTLDAYFRGLR